MPEFEGGYSPETEKPIKNYREILLDIYNSKEAETTAGVIHESLEELNGVKAEIGEDKFKENTEWLYNNNNRMNLYQIEVVLRGEEYPRAEEELDPEKAKQFFALRKVNAGLLSLGEIKTPESAEELQKFINSNSDQEYIADTAVEALGKNGTPEAQAALGQIIENKKLNFELRTRAVLSCLRNNIEVDKTEVLNLLEENIDSLGENICKSRETYNIIEVAGLLKGNESVNILDKIHKIISEKPITERQWFERDIVSTRISKISASKSKKFLESELEDRYFVVQGIVIGSLSGEIDFSDFMKKHKDKLEKVVETIQKINKAFGTEPIKYIDISSGDANEAGWTQNSIYFSKDYIEHSNVVEDLLQSAGHEACERWQTKGFIDTRLAKFYLELMGENYENSELDKFRLKHRMKEEVNAGHPWDGEREFIAELGSTLLVDEKQIDKIFDKEKDKTSLKALEYLKKKLKK